MKTAFITGAGRGLGKGFVEYLLKEGFLVFAGVRDESNANRLSPHENLRILAIDITDDGSIDGVVSKIAEETDHLDYLINNAGVNKDTATNNHKELVCNLEKLDRSSLLTMFDVNTISPMIVLQKCLPLLSKADSFVVNISSDRASYHDENKNLTGNYGYRASKTALNMMTFCSLYDLPPNVRTFCVHPGNVRSDMNPIGTDLPYDQAEKMVHITKNWKNEFNGRYLRYDGTFYPL